eukprot:2030493-Amphidinium_carterae.1
MGADTRVGNETLFKVGNAWQDLWVPKRRGIIVRRLASGELLKDLRGRLKHNGFLTEWFLALPTTMEQHLREQSGYSPPPDLNPNPPAPIKIYRHIANNTVGDISNTSPDCIPNALNCLRIGQYPVLISFGTQHRSPEFAPLAGTKQKHPSAYHTKHAIPTLREYQRMCQQLYEQQKWLFRQFKSEI